MTKGQRIVVSLLSIAAVLLGTADCFATLIGDEVTFECTNCGPPTLDTFIVQEGIAELVLFNALEVDVEASTLRITWLFDSNSIIPDINFIWSDLDWTDVPGEIIGVTIDPSSTWGTDAFVDFTADSVSLVNNADQTVTVGDFWLAHLEVNHVPGDSDGDGIPDDEDACPDSDLAETIVIDGCDSGVENMLFGDGCTMADLIAECADGASNHGDFVSCVAHLTNEWKRAGLITGQEKGAIQSCAAQSNIPGDLDGDGAVGIDDFLLLLGAWGSCPAQPDSCPADVDLDSNVGITDLLILLGNWS